MCDFKIWLETKLDGSDYWNNRAMEAFFESETLALITILDDWAEGLICLSPSEQIILKSKLDEFEGNVV